MKKIMEVSTICFNRCYLFYFNEPRIRTRNAYYGGVFTS